MGTRELLLPELTPPGAQPGHLADNSCSGGLGTNSFIRGNGDVVEGKWESRSFNYGDTSALHSGAALLPVFS